MTSVNDLVQHITLEKIGEAEFVGHSKTVGSPNVFGGQVLAQAINAASRTVADDRSLHSMHAYFLEAGHLEWPILYSVSIVRDGGSFSVRRVTAHQYDTIIFILSASFHKKEGGYEHQIEMPKDIQQPEALLSWTDMVQQFGDAIPPRAKGFMELERPMEFKPVEVPNPHRRVDLAPVSNVWFRLKGDVTGLDLPIKQQLLTYLSDYNILAAAMNRHAGKAHWGNTQTASLDHSMWYFRDFDFDDWLLYAVQSPNASNAKGFSKGNIFSRDGKLIASVAQEGLMRPQ